jgi:hypothetical protein
MAPNLRAIAGSYSGGKPVPGQWTTDPSVMPDQGLLNDLADIAKKRVQRAADGAAAAYGVDSEEFRLIEEIRERKSSVESEQMRLRALFRRWDNLYMPQQITTGGPDHWPLNAQPGRVHVSNNIYHAYIDIPSALQAYEPVENYVAEDVTPERRASATRAEHLYVAWKDNDEFETKFHKACIVKALYGITYGKVRWDAIEKRPTLTILENPENLYVGWGNSDYGRMDWAIYCYGLSKQAIEEDYGLTLDMVKDGDNWYPVVGVGTHDDPIGNVFSRIDANRQRPQYEMGQVEVYDYWYKKPGGKGKAAEIWNCIYVGNHQVENARHKEYEDIPYEPLRNTFVPGEPYGKSELYDLEQLLREKDERLTNAGQMIASITDGQRWQLVGSEAPDDLPANALPQPNKIATPGPNAEIKAIQPFVAEYPAESYLARLDHELETASGLNELLLGRAPATILGSSKAIAALVSNYESRIRMKRDLLYQWRKRIWRVTAKVWEAKDPKVKAIIDGQYRLAVRAPELTPHDNVESAQLAMSLVQNRLWSAERAMTETGVDDPLGEKGLIREEQSDPGLNPASVQAQVTLIGALQAQGIAPQSVGIGGGTPSTDLAANPPTPGTTSLNQPQNQANPPATSLPANALAANGAPAGPATAAGDVPFGQQVTAVNQSRLIAGKATGRITTQVPLNENNQGKKA